MTHPTSDTGFYNRRYCEIVIQDELQNTYQRRP
jgi:hypothetical protein